MIEQKRGKIFLEFTGIHGCRMEKKWVVMHTGINTGIESRKTHEKELELLCIQGLAME